MKARSALAAALAAVAVSLPATAGGEPAPRVKPSPGNYEAEPAKIKGSYFLGAFAVVSEGGKRRIVAVEGNPGIYYPDQGKCDSLSIPLTAETIPVNRRGRFSIRDTYTANATKVVVKWKGAWKKPKKVSGTIRIGSKGCVDEFKWTAKRVAAR